MCKAPSVTVTSTLHVDVMFRLGGNGHCVLEVTPAQEIVWKVTQNDGF